ncbi:hypothetical protein ACFSGI_17695 [Paenibacillus nicotianae]|uniref:HEAT repeat domain-containing protein n=1 Tax=Paenibacillus nicotianae TaxID=1526551 RepID=A0ABW4UW43_9BACL
MSTALLQELYQETRRLYIAGSELAIEDIRLRKLLPRFQQLGEKAPIFKRLGDQIESIMDQNNEVSSSERLQNLTLLLSSVLHTQGSVAVEGEIKPLGVDHQQDYILTSSTSYSYRKLAPVMQALSTTGGGRLEVIEHAFREGIFQDIRLMPLAIEGLYDAYSEIAELMTQKIVPSYGLAILPYLRDIFNPQGDKKEVRKLVAIQKIAEEHQLDLLDWYSELSRSASDDIRATAIRFLSGHEQYVSECIVWTKEKKKSVRESAYYALAGSSSSEAIACLLTASAGKDLEYVVDAVRYQEVSVDLEEQLAAAFARDVEQVIQSQHQESIDYKALEKLAERLLLFGKMWTHSQNEIVHQSYQDMLKHYTYLYNLSASRQITDWRNLLWDAARYIEHKGSLKDLELLYEVSEKDADFVPSAFRLSIQLLSPEQVYDQYVGGIVSQMKAKINKEAKKRLGKVIATMRPMLLENGYEHFSFGHQEQHIYTQKILPLAEVEQQWDRRWLEFAMKQDDVELVAGLARPGVKGVEDFLRKKLQDNPEFRNRTATLILRALEERLGISKEDKRQLMWQAIDDRRNSNSYMFEPYIVHSLLEFPVEDIERLEALLPENREATIPKFRGYAAEQLEFVVYKLKGMK